MRALAHCSQALPRAVTRSARRAQLCCSAWMVLSRVTLTFSPGEYTPRLPGETALKGAGGFDLSFGRFAGEEAEPLRLQRKRRSV